MAPDGQASDAVADGASRRHFVHVYAVIRVKVAVDARDHHSAMKTADDLLFANGLAVRLVPAAQTVLEAEYAEEVTGYLVDEAGDDEFVRSRSYGPDHEPEGDGA
ncbi:hypothetical protein K3M67_06565 [Sphingobium sp. V4]|nr:hypothetical protein [Sphingobium sp. V4]WIW89938.1 hypothetical protein K3M67_06565 [Sphingobium sp. V4]